MGKLRPSLARVWLNCPKAATLCAKYPSIETPFTLRGTALHLKAAYDVRDHFEIPQIPMGIACDDLKDIAKYVAFCDEMVKKTFILKKPKIVVEEKIDLSSFLFNGNGIVDFAAYDDECILIIDYKTGYKRVSVRDNPQLLLYAIGLANRLKLLGVNPRRVKMAIGQPSQDHFPVATIDLDYLYDWLKDQKQKINDAYNDIGEFTPGPHCTNCNARATCKAYLLYILKGGIDDGESEDA